MTLSVTAAEVPWTVWVVSLPLAAAAVCLVFRRGHARFGVAASLANVTAAAGLAWQVWTLGPIRYPVGGWGAPLGIDLYADGLSVVMLLLTAVVGVAVSIYAVGYFADRRQAGGAHEPGAASAGYFWPLWLFLWAALNALFLSGDIFNVYVTLEMVTLAAVGLVTIAGSTTAVTAALRYLLAALLGSLVYLLGVALLYASYGVLDVASLGRTVTAGAAPAAAVAAITIGLAMKGALFPLHFWLPQAHASAPAPVSAVLSALVVKASFYVILRLWFEAFPAVVSPGAGALLGTLGAAAIGWGSLHAFFARRLKTLVAYSTVAQLGYLFLVFTLAVPGAASAAWAGVVLFAIAHGCAKASMFMAAGSILYVAGHDRIAGIDGIGRRIPITFFTLALASVTLLGLPPSGAFMAKWLLLDAAIQTGHFALAVVIVGGGLLAAGYLFRVLAQAFTSSESEATLRVPRSMEWTAMALAVIALALGLFTAPLLDLLAIGGHVPDAARGAAP